MHRGTAPFRVDLRVLVIAWLALLLVAATSYRAFRPPRAWVNLTPLSFERPAQRSAPSTALQSEGPESETDGDVQSTKSPGERSVGTPGDQADGAVQVRPAEVVGAESLIAGEQEWLLACQLPDGAIAQTPDGETVVPYFASIAARTIVDIEPARARAYMSWYIQHMNLPDRSGLSGTIYDYEMRQGVLTPTFSYDSADSYAATFLSLASYYLSRTGDRGFISANLDAIDLAASVILTLQDKEGLVLVFRLCLL